MLVLSFCLLWYGNSLPGNISLYSRYNQTYEGQINIVTVTGLILLLFSVAVLLYGVLTRSKAEKTTAPTAFQETNSKSYRLTAKH